MFDSFSQLRSQELNMIDSLSKTFSSDFSFFSSKQSEGMKKAFNEIQSSFNEYIQTLRESFMLQSSFSKDTEVLKSQQEKLLFYFNDMFTKDEYCKKLADSLKKEQYRYTQAKSSNNLNSRIESAYKEAQEKANYGKQVAEQAKSAFNALKDQYKVDGVVIWINAFLKVCAFRRKEVFQSIECGNKILETVNMFPIDEDPVLVKLKSRREQWDNEEIP